MVQNKLRVLRFLTASCMLCAVCLPASAHDNVYRGPNDTKQTADKQPASTSLRGRVIDKDGLPIPGATVRLKGTTAGTATDTNGNFNLVLPKGWKANNPVLVFSFIGMLPQEIAYPSGGGGGNRSRLRF